MLNNVMASISWYNKDHLAIESYYNLVGVGISFNLSPLGILIGICMAWFLVHIIESLKVKHFPNLQQLGFKLIQSCSDQLN